MLTSLLSLYIASSLEAPVDNTSAVQAAGISLSTIIESQAAPIKDPHFIEPLLDASSVIAVDLETETILHEKNAHERRQIASITKLMTAIVILEENEPGETVTVSENAASTEGSSMYLRAGEEIALENLIYGMIINSANDAAITLAEHNAGNVDAFVEKMNKKALSLGLINTHFANPVGLDDPENYSSAYDVAKLAIQAYKHKFIRHSAKMKELEVKSTNGQLIHQLKSTNVLLDSYLNIKGLKTGRTDGAGLCLTSVAENKTENQIITVVLNSPDRFRETKILIDWVFRAYTW